VGHHDGTVYQFEVQGRVPAGAAALLPDLAVEAGPTTTTLVGPVTDAAALYGVIGQLEALGLALVAVRPHDHER
jgi:hypothetical protein